MKKFTSLVLTFATVQMLAQTGPGGVGDATTNVLWLDASKLTLNNNDPVSSWTDVSGNSNNAVQSNGANQPIYLSTGINGMPAVSFDGVDDYLDLTNHISESEHSVFYVGQTQALTSLTYQMGFINANSELASQAFSNKVGHRGANFTFTSAFLNTVGAPYLLHFNVNPTQNRLLLGGFNSYGTYAYTGSANKSRSIIGANFYAGNYTQFVDGYISEVIMYNYDLDEVERIIVNNYLISKYNFFSRSSNVYYNISGYLNDVCGIGQVNGVNHVNSRGQAEVQISNPSGLQDSEFLFWGHNGNDLSAVSDLPSQYSGARWNRVWAFDFTGDVGTIDVRFYVGSNGFGTNNNEYYIINDDNGDFSSGGFTLIGPGVYDAATNSVTFSNVDLNLRYFTLYNSSFEVQTIQSGNWGDVNTWSCACVPDSTMNVKINNGHTVDIVASYVSTNHVTVDGVLNLNVNTISVKGDIIINGTFDASSGTVFMSGTTYQYIYNNSMTPRFDIYNYYQSNPSSVRQKAGNIGILNEYKSDGLYDNQTLKYLIFMSTATQTSYISPITVSTPFAGNVRTLRYISARAADWADISSAVQNDNFGTLDESLYFSGIGGNDGNSVDADGNIGYSAYAYDAINQQYDTVKSTSRVLNPAEGFEIFLGDDETNYNGGYFYNFGIPNFGNVSADAYLPVNTGEWALLGNPYMSWIEWVNVTKSGVPNEVWIYEASAGNYVLHNSGNIALPPMQGFWVQANANNPSVTFTESSKIADNSATFYRQVSNDNDFVLILEDNFTGYYHETRLRADMSASKGYDLGKDVTLLKSKVKEAPNIAFAADNKQLMVNYINAKQEEIILPLYVKAGNSGTFTFEVENVDLLAHYNYIELVDLENHKAYDLKSGNSVDVYIEKGISTNRFQLRLSKTIPYTTAQDIVYYRSGKLIMDLDFPTDVYNAQVEVYDIQGRMVLSENVDNSKYTLYLPEGLVKGTYIVKVIKSNQQISINKLIIKN